jgi:hypothetical protein
MIANNDDTRQQPRRNTLAQPCCRSALVIRAPRCVMAFASDGQTAKIFGKTAQEAISENQ